MVERPKKDIILLVSICFFAVLVSIAVAISLILASGINDTMADLEAHDAAMKSGMVIEPSASHSINSLTRQIGKLQPITYGIIAGSLGMLYGTLVALIWADRQRREEVKQAAQSAALPDELRAAEESKLERINVLELLYEISGTFAEGGSFEQMAQRIVDRFTVLPGAEWVTLRLPEENAKRLRPSASAGKAAKTAPAALSLTFGETLAHVAFRRGQPVIINDYPADPHSSPAIVDLGIKSMALIPITAGENTPGLFSVFLLNSAVLPLTEYGYWRRWWRGLGLYLKSLDWKISGAKSKTYYKKHYHWPR